MDGGRAVHREASRVLPDSEKARMPYLGQGVSRIVVEVFEG